MVDSIFAIREETDSNVDVTVAKLVIFVIREETSSIRKETNSILEETVSRTLEKALISFRVTKEEPLVAFAVSPAVPSTLAASTTETELEGAGTPPICIVLSPEIGVAASWLERSKGDDVEVELSSLSRRGS
jgi:hypothetical protein